MNKFNSLFPKIIAMRKIPFILSGFAGGLSARPDLDGCLNLIHPNKVQVLGEAEIRYLDSLHGVFMEVFTCA